MLEKFTHSVKVAAYDCTALLDGLQLELSGMEALLQNIVHAAPEEIGKGLRASLTGGKRFRPLLCYICFRVGGAAYSAAPLMALVELLHTASLIHDDVIDRSAMRRGLPTTYSLLGAKGAVRCGDYLLGCALELIGNYYGTGIGERLAHVSRQMCLGELQQQKLAYSKHLQGILSYFKQVDRKTAYFISACCYCGATAGHADEAAVDCLSEYGFKLGRAFQITDDIRDFTGGKNFGKPLGIDIRNGIFTLPLLFSLDCDPGGDMKTLAAKHEKSANEISELIRFVIDSGGVEKAREYSDGLCARAAAALKSLPESAEKFALRQLAMLLCLKTDEKCLKAVTP